MEEKEAAVTRVSETFGRGISGDEDRRDLDVIFEAKRFDHVETGFVLAKTEV